MNLQYRFSKKNRNESKIKYLVKHETDDVYKKGIQGDSPFNKSNN